MLRIYVECVEMVRDVRPYVAAIARHDREHAKQLKDSSKSVPLNVSEGSGNRGGNRRLKYEYALGSARETRANLEVAAAAGYFPCVEKHVDDRLDHIIGTLVKVLYK